MVQLQFRLDLAAGKEPLAYELVKDNEIDDYRFKIVGKERMTLDSGVYNTVKLEVVRDSTKRQTFVWMAPDLGWLPVRLTHFESGSKQLDIKLAKLSLARKSITSSPRRNNFQSPGANSCQFSLPVSGRVAMTVTTSLGVVWVSKSITTSVSIS